MSTTIDQLNPCYSRPCGLYHEAPSQSSVDDVDVEPTHRGSIHPSSRGYAAQFSCYAPSAFEEEVELNVASVAKRSQFIPSDDEAYLIEQTHSSPQDYVNILSASCRGHDERASRPIDRPAGECQGCPIDPSSCSRPLEPPEKNPSQYETVPSHKVVHVEELDSYASQLPGTMLHFVNVLHSHQSHPNVAKTTRAGLGANVHHLSQAVGEVGTRVEAISIFSRSGRLQLLQSFEAMGGIALYGVSQSKDPPFSAVLMNTLNRVEHRHVEVMGPEPEESLSRYHRVGLPSARDSRVETGVPAARFGGNNDDSVPFDGDVPFGDRHIIIDHRRGVAGSYGKLLFSLVTAFEPALRPDQRSTAWSASELMCRRLPDLRPDSRPTAWSAAEVPSWQFFSTSLVLHGRRSDGVTEYVYPVPMVRSRQDDTASFHGRINGLAQGAKNRKMTTGVSAEEPEALGEVTWRRTDKVGTHLV